MTARKYGGRVVETSNEDKVLFPQDGFTKRDLIDYYEKVADRMLPWLRGRPLVVERFPDGIASDGFFQKQTGSYFPSWIETVRVRKQGGWQKLVVCNDRATLLYLVNQAAFVLHPWLSRADRVDCPDLFVMDLDPPSADFSKVRTAARHCRKLFDQLDVPVFLKTTGSKGLHLVVPLSGKETFDTVREVARELARVLAARHPKELTVEQRIGKRRGRVYLDIARNAYAQTSVAPYSVRPLPGAPVSTPISWEELCRGRLDSRSFTIRNVLRRAGDPWAEFRRRRLRMATLQARLARLERPE